MSLNKDANLKQKKIMRGVRLSLLPLVLAGITLISLLAGCQLQDLLLPTATGVSQPTQVLATAATPEPQITISLIGTEAPQTHLVIWVPPQFDPSSESPAAEVFGRRIEAFQSIHPDVTVEVRVKAVDGRGGLLDSITTASSAAPKALPALVLLSTDDLESAALKELLLPLDSVYKNFGDSDWFPYANQLSTIENIHYGVPVAGDALVMAYRPLQSPFPPTTWQELALQNNVVSFPASDEDALIATSIYLASDGKLTNEVGAPTLQRSPLLKTFSIFNDGAQSGAFPYWLTQFNSFDQSWQSFVNQQAGYTISWVSQYLSALPDNVTISLVPKVSATQVTLAKGWVWSIPSQSMNQPYSIELLNYLSETDFINDLAHASGYLPVRQSGLTSWQNDPLMPVINDLVLNAQELPAASITHITNPILESSLVQVIKKQIYFQQAVDDAVKNFVQ